MKILNEVLPVSVVIPCYRCSAVIGRAIDSILAQTRKPFEVILVDDFSDDGDITFEVLNSIQCENAELVRVLRLDVNKGAASARNAGWDIATQPYIAFLDADDTWHPDKLMIQFEYMKNNQNVAISGHKCTYFPKRKIEEPQLSKPKVSKITPKGLLFRNAFSTPTIMLKKDISVRFQYGKRYAEDIFLWQQAAFLGLEIARLECTLAFIHKPPYGSKGLSANLLKMELGELNNFNYLFCKKQIGFGLYLLVSIFSLIKFTKRICLTKLRASFPQLVSNE